MDVVAGLLLVIGAAFVLLAGIGVVRFGDTFSRMHAAAKAPALGVVGLGAGAALSIGSSQAVVAAILVVVLQFIAGPVAAHLLGRAVYRRARPTLLGPDELERVVDAEQIDVEIDVEIDAEIDGEIDGD